MLQALVQDSIGIAPQLDLTHGFVFQTLQDLPLIGYSKTTNQSILLE